MFSPKPLPYGLSDYEPQISAGIMDLHYNQHYLGYLKNLNNAINNYPEYFQLQVDQILTRIDEIPEDIKEAVRNNGGGVINHEILWETLGCCETLIHEGSLKNAILETFGSWEDFEEKFITAGSKLFGSGWVWLVLGENKELKIITTLNQDSPYMNGLYPVFGIDVWEHAYYLQYKNLRASYLSKIWKILDWKKIEERFNSASN